MTESKYEPYREEILSGKFTAKEIAEMIGHGCKKTHIYAAKRRFLNLDKCLESTQKWRRNHQKEANKHNYRAKHSQYAPNNRANWTGAEDKKVMDKSLLAKDVAKKLGRTMGAIYSRRVFLNEQRRKKQQGL